MKQHLRNLLALGCGLLGSTGFACSRSEQAPAPGSRPSASAAVSAAVSAVPVVTAPARPQHPAEKVLITWSSALDRHDLETLGKLYAPHVRFYGVRKPAAEVVGAKRNAFTQDPDYHQRVDEVLIEKAPTGFTVRFQKLSGPNLANEVAARLVLESVGDQLVIVEESDAATDKRFKKTPPPACYAAVSQIVTSLSAVDADIRRVARTDPQLKPGGILYEESPQKLEAAQGYFHRDRFEPRWWIEVVSGVLNVRNALTDEGLAISGDQRESARQACSPATDAGADAK
ncbi:MAG TPA: hypothetical protein VM686_25325 [Polyangiaceae bacterium]|nr:hypothetical protein [Polyangiaceae bacterium]